MKLTCILFDHDDTLLPTFALRVRALDLAAREILGQEIDAQAVMTNSQGRNLEKMSGDLTDGDAELAALLVKAYRGFYYQENQQGLQPYPEIAALLEHLQARSIKIAVVTSKLATGARDELIRTGLMPYIQHLTGAEDVREHKPCAEPLLRATTALNVNPQQCMMVGDTAADILGARAAGTVSGAALWGARDADGLKALQPDHLLDNPSDILQLV